MEISKIKPRPQFSQWPLSPQNADSVFSMPQGSSTGRLPKNFSFQKRYPETVRHSHQQKDAAQFISFVRRMSKNDSDRLYTESSRVLNSTLKSVRASTARRSETEAEETTSKGNREQTLESRISGLDRPKLPVEISPSDLGSSNISVVAFESDIKYLQKLVRIRDEEIEILKKEKEIMTRRYIEETEAMQQEVDGMRTSVRMVDGIGRKADISKEIDKVKRELHMGSKGGSLGANRQDSIKEVMITEQSQQPPTFSKQRTPTKIDRSSLRLSIITDTPKLPDPLLSPSPSSASSLEQTILAYDLANRELTRSLAICNDQLATSARDKQRYETIIFQLQNENQLFRKQISEQKRLLETQDSKRGELRKTLGRLRQWQ